MSRGRFMDHASGALSSDTAGELVHVVYGLWYLEQANLVYQISRYFVVSFSPIIFSVTVIFRVL
jgi:hypothetical protein